MSTEDTPQKRLRPAGEASHNHDQDADSKILPNRGEVNLGDALKAFIDAGATVDRDRLPEVHRDLYDAFLQAHREDDGKAFDILKRAAVVADDETLRRLLIERGLLNTPKTRLTMTCFRDIEPKPINWLWPGRIPEGKLTIFVGEAGVGKTMTAIDVAARISTGAAWPDAPAEDREAAEVIIMSAEDDPHDTLRPRLDVAGADVDNVHHMRASDIDMNTVSVTEHLQDLEVMLLQNPQIRLFVIDPLNTFMGDGVNTHKESDVRRALHPFMDLASRTGVAILAVMHPNKSETASAVNRTSGSTAFVAIARTVWMFGKDREDEARRYMLPVKNNIADDSAGLAYSVVAGAGTEIRRICWESDPVCLSAEQVFGGGKPAGDRPANAAAAFLADFLSQGPVASTHVFAAAEEEGLSEKSVRRAAGRLGVQKRKTGMNGNWEWSLPKTTAA